MSNQDSSHNSKNDGKEPNYSPCLVIHDGIPWYASADIWVVPGNNPNGLPGAPQPGQSNWIWARVWNEGQAPIYNAVVNFYWADPSTTITRATAHLVGTTFVNLPPLAQKDVCCPVAWNPTIVNGGHECLIVEAFEPLLDPLLYPGSGDFNVTLDRHVAQRNVIIISAEAGEEIALPFLIANLAEGAHSFSLHVQPLTLKEASAAPLLDSIGLRGLTSVTPKAGTPALHLIRRKDHPLSAREMTAAIKPLWQGGEIRADRKPNAKQVRTLRNKGRPVSSMDMEGGEHALVLALLPPGQAAAGKVSAYTITQQAGDDTLGGILVLVVHSAAHAARSVSKRRTKTKRSS